jgi:hypothetical protein
MGLASMILPALSFGDAISNIIAGMSDFAATEKGVAQLNTQLKATEGIAGFTSDQLEEMNEVMQ